MSICWVLWAPLLQQLSELGWAIRLHQQIPFQLQSPPRNQAHSSAEGTEVSMKSLE